MLIYNIIIVSIGEEQTIDEGFNIVLLFYDIMMPAISGRHWLVNNIRVNYISLFITSVNGTESSHYYFYISMCYVSITSPKAFIRDSGIHSDSRMQDIIYII